MDLAILSGHFTILPFTDHRVVTSRVLVVLTGSVVSNCDGTDINVILRFTRVT